MRKYPSLYVREHMQIYLETLTDMRKLGFPRLRIAKLAFREWITSHSFAVVAVLTHATRSFVMDYGLKKWRMAVHTATVSLRYF